MMKKIVNKFLIILVMLFVFLNFMSFEVLATNSTGSVAIDKYNKETTLVDKDSSDSPAVYAENFIGRLIYIIQIILLALALIMIIVVGIKFVGGSIEEKVEIKKHISMYVLGAILLFTASGIVSLLRMFFINVM